MKSIVGFVTLAALSITTAAYAQSAAPSLVDRFAQLSCAVAHFKADGSSGTGFFVDAEGDFLTAAHVAVDRTYEEVSPGNYSGKLSLKSNAVIARSDGTEIIVPTQNFSGTDFLNGTRDLALISTGQPSKCHIPLGNPAGLMIGAHLISIGFPGVSPTGVLYEGFLSAKHSDVHTLGPVSNKPGEVLQGNYDVLRIQMPITPGASGSPLIDDKNEAVGVVTEVPVLALADIQNLISTELSNGKDQPQLIIGGFNTNMLLAELSYVVTQFETPGSGFAVPVTYLGFSIPAGK